MDVNSAYWAKKDGKRAEITAWIIRELEAKGVRVYIDSCGCCRSPWISVEIDGVLLTSNSPDGNNILKLYGECIDMLGMDEREQA